MTITANNTSIWKLFLFIPEAVAQKNCTAKGQKIDKKGNGVVKDVIKITKAGKKEPA